MIRAIVAALCSFCLSACIQEVPPRTPSPTIATPTSAQANPSDLRAEFRSPLMEAFEDELSGKTAEKRRYARTAFFQSVPPEVMDRDLTRIDQDYEQRKQQQFEATIRRMQQKSSLPWDR